MKIINHFALLLLFGCAVSCTQPENSISNESIGIIPLPSTYELKPGTFYITGQSRQVRSGNDGLSKLLQ